MSEPAALLEDLSTLRRRTRQDAHGYWLPLLLFGGLILAAALVYRFTTSSVDPPTLRLGSLYARPLALFSPSFTISNQLAVGLYWLGAIIVGTLVTLGWYRWRAQRIGVQLRTRAYLLYAVGALLVCIVLVPLTTYWTLLGSSSSAQVWSSAGAFVVGIGFAVLFRRFQTLWARTGFVLGVVITLVAYGNLVLQATTHSYGGLLVIAPALFGLAWMERSALCGTVAVLFTGASLLTNLYDIENLLPYTTNQTLVTFYNLLLPGLVLIIGGIVALTREIRQ